MKKKVNKKFSRVLAIFMTVFMLIGMIPQAAFADTAEAAAPVSEPVTYNMEDGNGTVYVSVSYDGQFVQGTIGAVAYKAVDLAELEAIDLSTYGLSDYYYDGDGDGAYDITALHLYIYVHEQILGLDWNDVRVSGSAGSIFFEAGLFGFVDCNLQYYLNGAYPEASPGWGATADIMPLSSGDFYDIAGFTS